MELITRFIKIEFELEGNDFPISFLFDPILERTEIHHDGISTVENTQDFDELFEVINRNFINVTDLHDREFLESDIWLSFVFQNKNYFVIGTDYRVREAKTIHRKE